MRQIKFRAWDSETMIYSDNDIRLGMFFESTEPMGTKELRVLMQYTGLKDKNGVEIYESDLVLDSRIDEGNIYEIKWGNAGFYANDLEDEYFWDCLEYLEVIGNIHEGIK